MSFTFNNDIPATNNNPADDQPKMLVNNQSIDSIWAQDHIGFNASNGGFHQHTRFINETIPTTIASSSTFFSKDAIGTVTDNESAVYFTPDATTDEYQMTRTVTASTSEFATYTNYPPGVADQDGGWTFLPGGMLLQYGQAESSGTSFPNTTVNFPVDFTNTVYSVTCTILTTTDSRFFVELYDLSNNQFRAVTRNSGGSKTSGLTFTWMAIGV